MQTTRTDFRIAGSTIMLGDLAKDDITGFKGIVTGRARYLTGCDQVCIVALVGKDQKVSDSCWFDIGRISVVRRNPIGIERTLKDEVPSAG